jgi:methylenetetrahydrofolate dehydrogenase (NADP+)/methenyltetrahydrofolate cyclohydrolase
VARQDGNEQNNHGALIDGRAIAKSVRARVKEDAAKLIAAGITPCLTVVLVGDDPASAVYVRNKQRACKRAGILSIQHDLPATTSQSDLLALLNDLNQDASVHGILVQMPLPKHIDESAILEAIDPNKDVDGFHPLNVGYLAGGKPRFVPCTAQGVIELLDAANVPIEGANAVVIGRSHIVGRPTSLLLTARNATVTVCHSRTKDLQSIVRQADIIVAAVGRTRLVKADWVKPGAAVIDVGINRLDDGSLAGDVDFDAVLPIAGAITPVPGGVGPMTIAILLVNTLRAAAQAHGVTL